MQNLIEIKDASILVVVAHPDDETLWFYQSLQILKSQNEITVFCLTYSAESVRGKELVKLSQNIGIQVEFGHCKDTGINCLMDNLEVMHAFHVAFSRNKYDLVITHPPHGGEKPHPHHIQSYVATKKLCKSYHVGFGFFCETKLLNVAMDSNVFRLNGDTKKYILLRLIKACQFLKNDKLQIAYIVKFSFSVLFDFNKYSAFEQEVDLIAKKDALLFFESQIVHLKTYAHYNNISEFLYLELPHHFG